MPWASLRVKIRSEAVFVAATYAPYQHSVARSSQLQGRVNMGTITVGPVLGRCAPRDVVPTRHRVRTALTSRFVGVSQDRKSGGWSASIRRGDVKRTKWFRTERDAADQRREWELELDGPMGGATPANRVRYTSNGRIKVQAICPDGGVRMCEQASKMPVASVPFGARCWVNDTTITGYLTRCNGYWHFVVDTQLTNANVFDQPDTRHKPQRVRITSDEATQ